MVVFLDGEPAKSEYRTFKVKTATNDDFASMYEVLSRRFRRARSAEPNLEQRGWVVPDLLVIDGGKGQLSTALAALKDAQIDTGMNGLDVVGLAKEREDQEGEKQPDRVFLARAKDPIKLRPNSAELFVLSRIRDEAHRFAVTFHKKLRRRRTLRSALEDVPGVGQKRKKLLLTHLGSLRAIKGSTVEELARVPGMSMKAAEAVVQYFHGAPPEDEAPDDEAPEVEAPEVDEAAPTAAAPADRDDVAEDAASAELAALAGDLPEDAPADAESDDER
jgi:excinuclease ABC subunit C